MRVLSPKNFSYRTACCWLLCLGLFILHTNCVAAENAIGRFDATHSSAPPPWQLIRFDKSAPPTNYSVKEWDGLAAVEARAESSMALLGRKVEVDLHDTPILCWRWRVEHVLKSADIHKRSGDDYAARIYLAFSLPEEVMSLTTKATLKIARSIWGKDMPDAAINYVWDNKHPIGMQVANAYTSRAQMIVQQTGNTHASKWIEERVNVKADVAKLFGTDKAKLFLLAIAADSDNTKENVKSGFADLHFVSEDQSCNFTPTIKYNIAKEK
jgi:hypothetical protein